MSYAKIALPTQHSLSKADRMARGTLSAAALLAVLSSATLSITWAFALTMVSIYAGLTGILGEDPFYSLGRRDPGDRGVHPEAAPDESVQKPVEGGDERRTTIYKDAA